MCVCVVGVDWGGTLCSVNDAGGGCQDTESETARSEEGAVGARVKAVFVCTGPDCERGSVNRTGGSSGRQEGRSRKSGGRRGGEA